MEATVREMLSIHAEKYSIVILDSDTGALLDYSRLGEVDPEEAARIVWNTYKALVTVYGNSTPIEADVMSSDTYVKVVFEPEAGIIRGVVTIYSRGYEL